MPVVRFTVSGTGKTPAFPVQKAGEMPAFPFFNNIRLFLPIIGVESDSGKGRTKNVFAV
jgi:hypothetical protein